MKREPTAVQENPLSAMKSLHIEPMRTPVTHSTCALSSHCVCTARPQLPHHTPCAVPPLPLHSSTCELTASVAHVQCSPLQLMGVCANPIDLCSMSPPLPNYAASGCEAEGCEAEGCEAEARPVAEAKGPHTCPMCNVQVAEIEGFDKVPPSHTLIGPLSPPLPLTH